MYSNPANCVRQAAIPVAWPLKKGISRERAKGRGKLFGKVKDSLRGRYLSEETKSGVCGYSKADLY